MLQLKLKKGKVVLGNGIDIDCNTHIRNLDAEETYKYLGTEEVGGIKQEVMKEKIKKVYYQRVKQILKTQLNAKNKIIAINNLAIPVVSYSYGILEWLRSDLQKIDRRTRKLLTLAGAHHPNADVDRLYFSRSEGGRGFISIENSFERQCSV